MDEQNRELLRQFEQDYLRLMQTGENGCNHKSESLFHQILEAITEESLDLTSIPNPEARAALVGSQIKNQKLRRRFAAVGNCLKTGNRVKLLELLGSLIYFYDEEECIQDSSFKRVDGLLRLYFINNIPSDGYEFVEADTYDIVKVGESRFIAPELLKTGDYLEIRDYDIENDTYRISAKSRIVLEPDFLIDVTNISESFNSKTANPYLFLLNLLKPFTTNENIFRGLLINNMLDKLMVNPDMGFDSLFGEMEKEYPLETVLYLAHMNSFREELRKNHFPALANIAGRLKRFTTLTEPSYLSPENGLKGRFDLLVLDGERQHLLELKGGKAPDFGCWYPHRVQTGCYDLMLKEAGDGLRKGDSFILYSKAGVNDYLRKNPSSAETEIQIRNVRNAITAFYRDLCLEDVTSLLTTEMFADCPEFIRKDVRMITEGFENLEDHEKAYYRMLINYTVKEMWFDKTGYYNDSGTSGGGFNALWRYGSEQKADSFLFIPKLLFSSEDNQECVFSVDENIPHRFREDDCVILYPRSEELFRGGLCLRGNFKSYHQNKIRIEIRGSIPVEILKSVGAWSMEADSFDSNHQRIIKSLTLFVKAERDKRALLLGERSGRIIQRDADYSSVPEHLRNLLETAFKAEEYYLLQGPPGTGKTSGFLMNYVRLILGQSDENICLAAFTNRAVDEICSKLTAAGISFCRLRGSGAEIYEATDFKSVEELRISVSTMHTLHAQISYIKALYQPHTLIVDEASQLLEQHLIGILSQFRKFILIGDDRQLPAVTPLAREYGAIDNDVLNNLGIINCAESLFTRMFRQAVKKDWKEAYGFLTRHYRMHEEIARLVNHNYEGRLTSVEDRQRVKLPVFAGDDSFRNTVLSNRVIFINVKASETPNRNQAEAQMVADIIKVIDEENSLTDKSLGVITAFRAQINLINMSLSVNVRDKVTIDTVERYQGSEREVIIFSPALNSIYDFNSVQSLDFEGKVDRKLNVAISRARERFILLGDAELLSQNTHYRHLLKLIPTHWSIDES
jgi:hypothetical protein